MTLIYYIFLCINNIVSCIYNYSIDIIPHCVNFFRTKFDICALFNLKYNRDLHRIYILDVFVQPYMPVFLLNTILVLSETSLIVDTSKQRWTTVWVAMMILYLY